LCKIIKDQKVNLTALHLRVKARIYISSYILGKRNLTWDEFIYDTSARFKYNLGSKVVEEFNKLIQIGSLDYNIAKFEQLKALLLQRNSTMLESYFLESIIGDLSAAVKQVVRSFKLILVNEAIEYARQQEESIQAPKISLDGPQRAYTQPSKPLLTYPQASKIILPTRISPAKPLHNSNKTTQIPHNPTRFISASENQDLCYFCYQPFYRKHKCGSKEKQLFLLEVLDEYEDVMEEVIKEPELVIG